MRTLLPSIILQQILLLRYYTSGKASVRADLAHSYKAWEQQT